MNSGFLCGLGGEPATILSCPLAKVSEYIFLWGDHPLTRGGSGVQPLFFPFKPNPPVDGFVVELVLKLPPLPLLLLPLLVLQ